MTERSTYQELDEKIVYSILYIVIFVAAIYTFYDFFLARYWSALADLGAVTVCMISYSLIRYRGAFHYVAIPTIYAIFGLCIVNFFLKHGFYGSASLNLLLVGFVIALVFYGNTRLIMLTVYAACIGVLCYIQLYRPELIPNLYDKQDIWRILFGFIIYLALMAYLAIIIREEYRKEREISMAQKRLLVTQRREISEKTQEIVAQQEEITSFNEQLELLVSKRTEQLANQNKQLADYIDFNTVKVSSPLGELSALGAVINALLSEGKVAEAQANIFKINYLSLELDTITKEINQILTPDHE